MKRFLRNLSLVIIILLLVDCEQPTEYEEVETAVTEYEEVETTVTETEYVEVEVETVITEIEYVIEYIDVPTETIVTEYVYVSEVVETVEYIEVESFVEVEVPVVETVTVTEIEYIDNIIETIIYIDKEIYIVSETTTNESAITVYANYVTTDYRVYGISDGNFVEIENVTGLFIDDNVLYFNMKVTTTTTTTDSDGNETEETYTATNAYSQTDGVLTLLEELPTEPDSEYTEFEDGDFKVETGLSGDIVCSYVYNGTVEISYIQVDGACMANDDLLFSVPTTYSTRYKGVYKYESDDGCPRRKFDNGRIW